MKPKPTEVSIKRRREYRAFPELSHANFVLLENAEKQENGWPYECMAAILMSAFKMEAYLNHIGKGLLPYWEHLERLPWRVKLNIVRAHLGIEKKDGERPFQTLKQLFDFRNELAHNRDELLDPPESTESGDIELLRRKQPKTSWESRCTLEFARQTAEDVDAIVRELHCKAELPEEGLRMGGQQYTIRRIPESDSL